MKEINRLLDDGANIDAAAVALDVHFICKLMLRPIMTILLCHLTSMNGPLTADVTRAQFPDYCSADHF